jgi:general secretion pathway protein F
MPYRRDRRIGATADCRCNTDEQVLSSTEMVVYDSYAPVADHSPRNMPTKPLSIDAQANLFLQLAKMECAGIPPLQALDLLGNCDNILRPRALLMRRGLQSGYALAESGFKAGVFDDNQKALVEAAESGGKLASVYERLANHYQGRSQRLNRVRSRLYLPALSLLLAMFAQPLPALVTGTISGGQYLLRVFGVVTVIALGSLVVTNLSGWLEKFGLKTGWDGMVLRLPWARDWLTVRQLNESFFMLGLLLDAGLAFSDALPKAVATIRNRVLRSQFAPAVARCGSGASAVAVLGEVAAIRPPALQILASGEQSGKLADALLHFVRSEEHTIALQDEALAEWLPRLVYGGIAGWMAYSALTSGAFFPRQ